MKKYFLPTIVKKYNKIAIVVLLGISIVALGMFVLSKVVTDKSDFVVVRVKGSPGNWWWVTPRPPDWLVSSIHVGDKEYSSLNKPTAEVLDLNIYDAGGSTKDLYMYVRLAAKKNRQTGKYRYKGENLEIGGPINLSLNNVLVPGMVTEIHEGSSIPQKTFLWKTVTVRMFDKWPWEYDAITIGEVMTDGVNTIAEIVDKTFVPSPREPYTYTGQLLAAGSPIQQDFILTLKIRVEPRGSDTIFREEQYVKLGNGLWIQFPSYNVSGGIITAIHEIL
ncbi:MAG: hypothetical protein WAV51_00625 [Microgenomates group bacterium]